MRNFFKEPRRIIRLIAMLVLLVVGGIYAQRFISGMLAQKNNQGAKDLYYHSSSSEQERHAESEPMEASGEESLSSSIEENARDPLDENGIAVDFHELLKVNADIVGWLTAGDRIDFPVVHGDNDYYLYHDYKKDEDPNGSIFMNSLNCLDPRDDILMIFGHDMTSGAMFAPLMSYMKYDYLCRFPVVTFRTIYDPQPVYYTPVTAIDASMIRASSNYFDITRINFEDEVQPTESGRSSPDFQRYLDESAARSFWRPEVDFSVNDQYILLVTCSYNSRDDDRRFCLLCRQLRPDETPEMIETMYAE